MCDFKPGDEVVCINDDYREQRRPHCRYATKGVVYRVLWMDESQSRPGAIRCGLRGLEWTTLDGARGGHAVWRFRKVQRRDLGAWLDTAAADTDHLDKPIRAPAHPDPVVTAFFSRIMAGGDR